jgi:hypothetical protein
LAATVGTYYGEKHYCSRVACTKSNYVYDRLKVVRNKMLSRSMNPKIGYAIK